MDTPGKQLINKTYIQRIVLGILVVLFGYMYHTATISKTRQTHRYTTPPETHTPIIYEDLTTIHEGELFLTTQMLQGDTTQELRPYIIRQLISQGFSDFITYPYASGNNTLTSRAMGSGYEVLEPITEQDDLDTRLNTLGTGRLERDILTIPESTRSTWSGLFLFKTTQDLYTMGYEVVSHRQRINKDTDYRRFNIFQSFKLMGNVRIILPGEELQFLEAAQYDEYEQQNYVQGYVIKEGEEEKEYGGGICGASTAVYQGILTNTGLEVTKRRAHTKRFGNLYTAEINHQNISTPGIDSAIYYGLIDLWMKNISPHPIILVMNYDGSEDGVEEVFTLSMPTNLGSFEFVKGGYIWSEKEVDDPEGTGKIMEKIRGGCYTWLINGETTTSCYKEVW